MRYCFLDIDGVLNSENRWRATGIMVNAGRVKMDIAAGKVPDPGWMQESVDLLRKAQEVAGFKVVISSTWRFSLAVRDFHVAFDQYGWDTRDIIIGKTDEGSGPRGEQIKRWLNNYGKYPYQYCIIDDSTDMLDSQLKFFVQTTFDDGLTEVEYPKILAAFEIEQPSE